MKKLLLTIFAGSAFLLSSCSTTQLARQADSNDDDVYYTEAKAKIITPRVVTAQASNSDQQAKAKEQTYRTDEQLYGGNDYSDDRYYDDYSYDYGSRINRFYYNSPYRPYYDYRYTYGYNPWYTNSYDPFFYDPWGYRPGVSLWVGIGPRSWYNNYYGYSGYNNGYWGPYSYYNTYPGYYGGRNYANGNGYRNPNSRPRPTRGGNESYGGGGYSRGTTVTGGQPRNSYPDNGGDRVRRENDQPTDVNTTRRPRPSAPNDNISREREREAGTSASPSPARQERQERPARVERSNPPAQTRETYSPPPPPPSNNGGSNNSGGSSGGSSRGSGGGRPSRGGN